MKNDPSFSTSNTNIKNAPPTFPLIVAESFRVDPMDLFKAWTDEASIQQWSPGHLPFGQLMLCLETDHKGLEIYSPKTFREQGTSSKYGYGPALITVHIKGDHDGCKMELTHEGLSPSMHDDSLTEWSQAFVKLKNLVEKH